LDGNEWVKEWTLLRTTWCKRGTLLIWMDTSGETPVGMVKLEKAIEKSCSDVLGHTSEVCKGIPSDQQVPGCQGQSQLMGNVYNLCIVYNCLDSCAHGHE
jgi:hypothetical protein